LPAWCGFLNRMLSRVSEGRCPACSFHGERREAAELITNRKATAVLLASLAVVGALGCSSPGEPSAGQPTVSVTNPLCDTAGECRTLQIRAFVWAFPIPQPPWGLKVLGEIEGPTACLTFPAVWEVTVIGYEGSDTTAAVTDSTTCTWSPDEPDGVFLIGTDWPAFPGDTLARLEIGVTESFVPADAPGWTLTFTLPGYGGYPYTANLEASDACVPP
jgi:hypothetical protein